MTTESSSAKLDFGDAIRALKAGHRVAREGWNGKGMWLALSCSGGRLTHSSAFWSKHNAAHAAAQEHLNGHAMVLPCITMKTATGEILMGWLASQTDMLADDWVNLDAPATAAQPKRYTREDVDLASLKWSTQLTMDNPFGDKASYFVKLRDGREIRGAIQLPMDASPQPPSRIATLCAMDALRVANGEQP